MTPAQRLLLVILLLFSCRALPAQTPSDSLPAPRRTFLGRADSSLADTLRKPARGRRSPGVAMLLSAALPGAGQFYNQSYWKVPVVLGLGLYFASTWLDQNRRTEDYRQKYAASLLPNAPDAGLSSQYLSLREFYKEQRDTFAWYFVILYLVNVADAYVDASLYDFDVGPDLALRVLPVAPGPLTPTPGVTLRLSF